MDPPTKKRSEDEVSEVSFGEVEFRRNEQALTDVGNGDGVDESLLGHNIERLDVLLHEVLEVASDSSALRLLLGRDGGGARRVGKRHSDDLDDGGHGVGGEETSARSSSGAGVLCDRRGRA